MDEKSAGGKLAHNPPAVPAPIGGYNQGLEIDGSARYLFVSGQIPESVAGEVPAGFEAQCELVWANLREILRSADMTVDNLVKVTTFLTSEDQAETNAEVRKRVLGSARPALTVVVVRTLESRWLLEIEAVAAA